MEFRILGPLEIVEDGRQIAIGGSKQRALLAILLLHPNTVVARERLIDELWGASPPETATTALQVHVSQLRKALGHDAIVTRTPGYLIQVEDGRLDLDRFAALVESAREQEAAEAAETLRAALRLWRGPPLADVDDAVARPERGQLEEQRLSALERRIEAELELGLHAELVPELEALVRVDPLRERPRAQLMLALYRSGRQADALDVYSKGRRHLADELGLEPGEELRRLEKAILEHDPALAPPPRRRGKPDGDLQAAAPGATPEARRLLTVRRSRRVALIGALLFAGAIAAVAVVLARNSEPSSVTVLPDSVAVVDPESGRVVADVPIGGRPVAIAVGEGAVWVANADDQTVLRIDPETFEVVETIGGLGSEVSDLDVGFGSVWVAGGNDGTLTRIDPRLNAPERVIELGNPDAILAQPVFLVEAGAGGVWVLRGRQLLRIDPRTNEVDRSTRVPPVRSVSLGAGAGAAWLVPGSRLLRIDAASEGITGEKLLPGWNASDPLVVDGSLWLVAWADPTQILRLDPGSLTQEQSVAVPAELPFGLAATADALWTADHGSGAVWRIDRADGGSVPVADVGHHPISIAAGEGSVWVGVQGRKLTYG